MSRTKEFLFFGCFLLVAGLAFVLVFALRGGFSGAKEYNCNLDEMEPSWNNDTTSLNNYVSKDYKMIANFAGFIKFIHFIDETVSKVFYLPLNLIGIRYTALSEHNLLVLKTNCANLEFLIYQDENKTIVKQVLAFWFHPYRSYDHCYVQTVKFDTPANTHYACNKKQYYECIHTTDIDVWDQIELVTNRLEFEVDGQAYDIKEGHFSTTAVECPR